MTSLARPQQETQPALCDGGSILTWREPPGRLGDFVRRIKTYHRIPVDPAPRFSGSVYFAKVRASDSAAAISA